MTYLSLFSGAGGSEWAAKLIGGMRCVGYVENDDYCQKVLRQRIRDGIFDDAPIYPDVRTFDGLPYRNRVDCITAGFPCQPFSVAGRRKAAGDSRNMWPETIRVIREVQPGQCFLENVPGLLAGSHGYFGKILSDLADSGYDARWCVLSAADCGAPHLRKRLWVLAYANGKRQLQPGGAKQKQWRRAPHGSEPPCNSNSVRRDAGWSCKPEEESEAGSTVAGPSWWTVEPAVGRVAYGVADRKHRLRALGNGWVPAVAASAWQILTEGE